jgi:hypothetical protein
MSEVKSYKLGERIIYDLRELGRGIFRYSQLKNNSIVIFGDKKIYRVKSNGIYPANFIKLTKSEIIELKEEIDLAISLYEKHKEVLK